MTTQTSFDTTVPCMERDPRDNWREYGPIENRRERDDSFGKAPNAFSRKVNSQPKLYIPRGRFYDAYEAVCFANANGHTMTNFLTINWSQCGFGSPFIVNRAYLAFMERFAKFARQRNRPILYLTIFENSPSVGYHSHTLFHFPHYFEKEVDKWLEKSVVGADGLPVRGDFYEFRSDKDKNTTAQWNIFRYMFKCIDPNIEKRERPEFYGKTTQEIYELTRGIANSDVVELQRVRISRSINKTAQRLVHYRVVYDIREEIYPTSRAYFSDVELRRGAEERRVANLQPVFTCLEYPL